MMHHIIYKTTNLINTRYYIGMHSTKNINDGYLGSGRRLKAELNKYSKENFKREILYECVDRKELEIKEAEIVCSSLLVDTLCLNLKIGGEGGGKLWDEEHRRKFLEAASKATQINNAWKSKTFEARQLTAAKILSSRIRNGTNCNGGVVTHSNESKKKIGLANSIAQAGEKNSSYGTCWVTNSIKPIKIKKEQLDEYISNGYSRGRK